MLLWCDVVVCCCGVLLWCVVVVCCCGVLLWLCCCCCVVVVLLLCCWCCVVGVVLLLLCCCCFVVVVVLVCCCWCCCWCCWCCWCFGKCLMHVYIHNNMCVQPSEHKLLSLFMQSLETWARTTPNSLPDPNPVQGFMSLVTLTQPRNLGNTVTKPGTFNNQSHPNPWTRLRTPYQQAKHAQTQEDNERDSRAHLRKAPRHSHEV